MIRISEVEVFGWKAAIRGMRNPFNSWDKSDSFNCDTEPICTGCCSDCIGENDLALMCKLSDAGSDHAKFLRFIDVTLDINAPLYWWKEFDTYKVGTVANSCSTMHKIHAKAFTLDDFSHEHLDQYACNTLATTITNLNSNRLFFNNTKGKEYWYNMIQLLPSSFNQLRTVKLNYAVLKAMYHARKNHKLNEWREFCQWIETLPYAKELITNGQTSGN